MNSISSISDIEKTVLRILTEQSELEEQFVRNSLSQYGTMLNQKLGEQTDDIFDSITTDELVVFFEVTPLSPGENWSETESDDSISFYHSYNVHVIVYGDDTTDLSSTLIARLRTEIVRSDFYESGIYLEDVTDITPANEYKANIMWLRSDFDIHIACKMNIEPVKTNNSFNELNTLTIINT